jgi:hypothetical protein
MEKKERNMSGLQMSKLKSRTQLRDRSKRLFGNADRLEVAVAVAQSSGLVHAQELAEQLAISPPRVRTQLLAFVDAQVMRSLPRSGHIQNYERLDDPFWETIDRLVEEWFDPQQASSRQSGSVRWPDEPEIAQQRR